jgi:hypothetical protein
MIIKVNTIEMGVVEKDPRFGDNHSKRDEKLAK